MDHSLIIHDFTRNVMELYCIKFEKSIFKMIIMIIFAMKIVHIHQFNSQGLRVQKL